MAKQIQQDIFLGFGANLGNREAQIYSAIAQLKQNPAIRIIEVSSFYETEAVSKDEQPPYINAALKMETSLSPQELLKVTEDVEEKLGRTGKSTNESRLIDIDILFYNNHIICDEDLIIPHPLAHEREFVLIPMMDLSRRFEHPMLAESVENLYKMVSGDFD
ncbi:2-amino-4-hydroxy-6-hydroxymethyldihydropteridine diphosphokinase [bacterium]|nr:2-amino-4-hydroxy-6-hydroxymethyldihydropteridine diphosphokinase [bacterium]